MDRDRSVDIAGEVDRLYREAGRRVYATLVRLVGDFDLAEEVMHEAFAAALKQWPEEGMPKNPRAWLVSTGRFKAIDTIRRRVRFDDSIEEIRARLEGGQVRAEDLDEAAFKDDHLRLIFTCCHPALPAHAQVALTLREVCGLTTEEIAKAFLTSPTTIAQRIVRGKARIRKKRIPYAVPGVSEIPERLDTVLSVIYLVFNEGYAATSGDALTRADLSGEAIRLGRTLCELLTDAEVHGLLALMLFHESRRTTRTDDAGDIVLLEDQDRSRWDAALIAEAGDHVRRAMAAEPIGPYTIQAAISGVHAGSPRAEDTDWNAIVNLYDLLQRANPSPVVELNQAVAIAMRDGPEAGLQRIDALLAGASLQDYHLAHAARADLCRRLGDDAGARVSYEQALALTTLEPERRFLERRIADLS
jgi:RNA polymerase sigma-70 factor (ECF subfamily)